MEKIPYERRVYKSEDDKSLSLDVAISKITESSKQVLILLLLNGDKVWRYIFKLIYIYIYPYIYIYTCSDRHIYSFKKLRSLFPCDNFSK